MTLRAVSAIAAVLLLCAASRAEAGWIHGTRKAAGTLPAVSTLRYDASPHLGLPRFEDALDSLASAGGATELDLVVLHERVLDPDFQQELLALLRASAPYALEDAWRSSGIHDNPALLALRSPFRRAVLDSEAVARIRDALAAHGFRIASVEMEKLTLDKTDEAPRLRCFLWLVIERS